MKLPFAIISRKHEIKWDDDVAISSPATPIRASGNANAAPDGFGNANNELAVQNKPAVEPDALAMPNQNGNANGEP